MRQVRLIALADVHLCPTAPSARSTEPDWLAALARPLVEVLELKHKFGVPVVCAGDLFDAPTVPSWLITWAIENLPTDMICVPGNHDLHYHSLKDIRRSAYWTLVAAGKIRHLDHREPLAVEGAVLHGFPCGVKLRPCRLGSVDPFGIRVAVVHAYIWQRGANYTGAPADQNLRGYRRRLRGYDVAVFGDNHMGFKARVGDCTVFNCGSLLRRHSDQIRHQPKVGLVWSDGTVTGVPLDVSRDHILTGEVEEVGTEADPATLTKLMEELADLGAATLDYAAVLRQYLDRVEASERVRRRLLKQLEKKR